MALYLYAIQGTYEQATDISAFTSINLKNTNPLIKSKKNVNFKVVTYDVESAISLVKEKYPDLLITAVSLKEKVDSVDPNVVMELFEKKEGE